MIDLKINIIELDSTDSLILTVPSSCGLESQNSLYKQYNDLLNRLQNDRLGKVMVVKDDFEVTIITKAKEN